MCVYVCVMCRIPLVGAVALGLHHSAGQLEAENAGPSGLDESIFLWQRHLTLLDNY